MRSLWSPGRSRPATGRSRADRGCRYARPCGHGRHGARAEARHSTTGLPACRAAGCRPRRAIARRESAPCPLFLVRFGFDVAAAVAFDRIADQRAETGTSLDRVVELEIEFRSRPQAHLVANLDAQVAGGVTQRVERRVRIADAGERREIDPRVRQV